jgi:hypothetical protein
MAIAPVTTRLPVLPVLQRDDRPAATPPERAVPNTPQTETANTATARTRLAPRVEAPRRPPEAATVAEQRRERSVENTQLRANEGQAALGTLVNTAV